MSVIRLFAPRLSLSVLDRCAPGSVVACRLYSDSNKDNKDQGENTRKYTWKWAPIPIGAGIVFLGFFQLYRQYKNSKTVPIIPENPEIAVLPNWQINLLRALPLRAISKLWGSVTHIDLPTFIRSPVYRAWARVFHSNIDEASATRLSEYPNLATFFVRALKSGLRPMSTALVVSPADGRILHFGEVSPSGLIEQVKGVTYSLESFLQGNGKISVKSSQNQSSSSSPPPSSSYLNLPVNHKLYYCVIYLGPGDYHRFHSPTSWTVQMRRHFPGDLLSVHPDMLRLVKGLFVFNERVCLLGKWPFGFFSMTAVGATNVGSIRINFDEDIRTNQPLRRGSYPIHEKDYRIQSSKHGISLVKGIEVGAFHLGSSIILIFEAPARFEFTVNCGQKIKLGEALGDLRKKEDTWYSPSQWWPWRPTKERSIRESPVKVVDIRDGKRIVDTKQ